MDAKDLAYKDYMKGMKYKEIAEKYGVSVNTVKSWKQRNGWDRKGRTRLPKDAPKKKGGQPGNVNAYGNKGGAAPKGNNNAEKHGFFSKWLPTEALEIMKEIEEKSPADIIWEQIMIQYTAIIRAQKLMFVKDQKDKTVEMVKTGDSGIEYDIQQAWDKHEKFLSAQSRAMTTLNGLIKQYEEMLRNDSESKEIAEERRARIAKIKAETTRINADKGAGIGDVIFSGEGDLDD